MIAPEMKRNANAWIVPTIELKIDTTGYVILWMVYNGRKAFCYGLTKLKKH